MILDLAMDAAAEGYTPNLAMFYDELLRQEVEDRCGQLGPSYSIAKAMAGVNEAVLRRAKR